MMYIKISIWSEFEIKNWIEDQCQSSPKLVGILTVLRCIFVYKFGNSNFNWWWLIACTSSQCGKFWLWNSIWPWRSWSIIPQNNRALNQGLLHLWSKFVDRSLTVDELSRRKSRDWRTHGHTHTQATTIPEGQNWPRVKTNKQWVEMVCMTHNKLLQSGSVMQTFHLSYFIFRQTYAVN